MTKLTIGEQWQRALARRWGADAKLLRTFGSAKVAPPALTSADLLVEPPSPAARDTLPDFMRRSRPLRLTHIPQAALKDDASEFAQSLRVLRRNNKLLLERFGVGWADAANVVLAESWRRSVPVLELTRLMTASLRRDTRGQAT